LYPSFGRPLCFVKQRSLHRLPGSRRLRQKKRVNIAVDAQLVVRPGSWTPTART
jgi:hypothetical protein